MSAADHVHCDLVASLRERPLTGDERDRAIVERARRDLPLASRDELDVVVADVESRLAGLGPLEALLANDEVTDVIVNGPGTIWVERAGRLEPSGEIGDADLARLVERIATMTGRRLDRASPCLDARLGPGRRVSVVLPPVAVDGPYVTIRRFAARGFPLAAYADTATQSRLETAVAERATVVISGGTGAGKTSLLNALCALVDPRERIVTIEDAAELALPHPHVARLEARPASTEGAGEVTIRDLVRTALRMRPDRLIVGEARGPEALDVVTAVNTGHEGSFTTVHANGPTDALVRLETLALMAGSGLTAEAIAAQVRAAVSLVVHVARVSGGARRITDVWDVGR